jgi:ABC-2 type transport system ATP-binding protein
MSTAALTATGLRKSFGDTVALDGIDLNVAEGTASATLGPNCAGKTTAVRILSTLIGPDDGEVRVAGRDAAREPSVDC